MTGHKDYLKQLPTIMKVVGVRTKEDVVIGKIPPHKLFPKSESCESFTSSEGEEEEEEGTQTHKTEQEKSSTDEKGSSKKKSKNGKQGHHKEEVAAGKEESYHQQENTEDYQMEDQNGIEAAGVSVEDGERKGDDGVSPTDSGNQSEGNNNDHKNGDSMEESNSNPDGNCDKDQCSKDKGDKSCEPEAADEGVSKLSIQDTSQTQ